MPIKYIPYVPETVEGQAILDNLTRTRRVLRYRENGKPIDRIRRGLPLYEASPVETVGDPAAAANNLLLRGECPECLRLPEGPRHCGRSRLH